MAAETIGRTVQAISPGRKEGTFTSILPFEILTRENI